MDRKEVQERVNELMHQLDTGQIDRPSYVEGMTKLQHDAGNGDA